MSWDTQDSLLVQILEALGVIWGPGAKAMEVQKDLDVRSLGDTLVAAERAGCEVSYVDLPESVSGFSTVIEGKPVIAVNRAKPHSHVLYTLCHELGHHMLHLNPSHRPDPLGIPWNEDMKEFEAHMFAASWALFAANSDEKEDVLRQNRESVILTLSIFLSLGVVVAAVGFNLWSRVSRGQVAEPVPMQ